MILDLVLMSFFFFFSFNVTFARYIARKKPRGDLLVTFKEL